MAIKYALHPGHVVSASDGDQHYISATTLAHLYGVPFSECLVVTAFTHQRRLSGLIHLYPRHNGDYTLPTFAAQQSKGEAS